MSRLVGCWRGRLAGLSPLAALLALLACSSLLLAALPVLGDSTSPECRALMADVACSDGNCADMTIDGDRAASSYYVVLNDFTSESCAVIEGCTQPGKRKLLRFDLATPNIGTGDLYLGDPSPPSKKACFEWSPCHAHYHFTAYADYTLLDATNNAVAVGAKASSCLMDAYRQEQTDAPVLPKGKLYTCQNQGIHKGYMDLYGGHLDCQWIDVTGLAPGKYTMRLEVNKWRVLPESNYDNNLVEFPVIIPADSDLPAPVDPESCPQWGGCGSCTNARGCGWCSADAKCLYGDYTGPAGESCGNWIWSASQCSAQAPGETDPDVVCGAQTTCGRCAATSGCGWCGATNKCVPGLDGGPTPESGASCPNSWIFGSVSQCPVDACLEKTDCMSCTSTAHCGWCTSTGKCNRGKAIGPTDASCGLWKWGTSQCDLTTPAPETGCLGLRLDSSVANFGDANALRGVDCPTGTNELPSGESCSFDCRSGYNLKDGTGTATCSNTAWTVKQPVCEPDSCIVPRPPTGLSIGCKVGARIASGNSFTYGVKRGYRLVSGSLTRKCFAGAYDHPPPVVEYYLDENGNPLPAGQSSATTMAAAQQTIMHVMSVGDEMGVGADGMMGVTGDRCSSAASCRECALRDGCGWDSSRAECASGDWAGADAASGSSASVATGDWKWAHLQCARDPPSAVASCAQANGACSACAGMRGCGYCPSTGQCVPATWLGPKAAGVCPADSSFVWDPSTCLASAGAVAVPAIGSLQPTIDVAPLLLSLNTTLDDLLKVDPAGNHFKRTDAVSHAFKSDADGNFLKHRRDVDYDAVMQAQADGKQRAAFAGARSRLPKIAAGNVSRTAVAASDDAASTEAESDSNGEVMALQFVDPYDFAPTDDRFPHGHDEHMHSHWGQSDEEAGMAHMHAEMQMAAQHGMHAMTSTPSVITDQSCNGVDEPQPEPLPEPEPEPSSSSSSSSTAPEGGEPGSSTSVDGGVTESSTAPATGGNEEQSTGGGETPIPTDSSSTGATDGEQSSSSSSSGIAIPDDGSSSGVNGKPSDGETGALDDDDSAASAVAPSALALLALFATAALRLF